MRRLLLLAALLLALPAAAQRAPAWLRVEILDRGLYEVRPGPMTQLPNGLAHGSLEAAELVRSTTAIPARPGVSFGVEYRVHGQPAGSPVDLTTTIRFPAPGLLPPGASEPVPELTTTSTVQVGSGDVSTHVYTFDHEWEVAPGPWRFEVRYGDQLLAVQSFIVTSESSLR